MTLPVTKQRAEPARLPAAVRRRIPSGPTCAAVMLAATALAAAARVSTVVFDRLPHVEDEVAFLFQARTIAAGHLFVAAPSQPQFFFIPFIVIRDGLWFGKYPPGYPAVLALGVLAGHAWLVNPVLAALTIGLVYVVGRTLYGAATGLLAGALLVTSPFFLLQSGSFMSHPSGAFWALACLLLFIHARRGSRWAALLAGVCLGIEFLARPLTAVGIGLPFLIWAAIEVVRAPRRALGYAPMLLGFIPFAGAFLLYNQATTGNPLRSAYELWWSWDKVGFGPGHGPSGAYTLAQGLDHMRFELGQLADYLFGWPLHLSLGPALFATAIAALALLGRVRGLRDTHPIARRSGEPSPEAWDLFLFGMAASLVLVHLDYWHGGAGSVQVYGPRYYYEIIGALALLSARGLDAVAALAVRILRRVAPSVQRPRAWATGGVLAMTGALVVANFAGYAPGQFARFTDFYNINGDGVRVVQAAHPHNALVFVASSQSPNYAWPDYAPFFCQDAVTLNGDVVYAMDIGLDRDRVLMALYPGREYLRYANGRLTPLTP